MKRKLLTAFAGLLVIGLSWVGCKTTRAGYEGPDYEVIANHGEVEIRRYQAMIGAATPMAPKDGGGRDSGFGRLFRFIDGDNAREEKIAMTSPVFVETDREANESAMIFLMPQKTIAAGVPEPRGDAVRIQSIKGGTFAALRFRGYRSKESQITALKDLREAIAKAGLESVGFPFFAYYDPPWIPEALRRNEVLWRLADE